MSFSTMFADTDAAFSDAGNTSPPSSHAALSPDWELQHEHDDPIVRNLASYGILVETPDDMSNGSSLPTSPFTARSGLYQGGPWQLEQACSIRRIDPAASALLLSPSSSISSDMADINEELLGAHPSSPSTATRAAILARGPRQVRASTSSTHDDPAASLLFDRLSLQAFDSASQSDSREVSRSELTSDFSYASTVPTSADGSDDECEGDKEYVLSRRDTLVPSINVVASSPWSVPAVHKRHAPQAVPASSESADADEEQCEVCRRPESRCRNYACLLPGFQLESDDVGRESSVSTVATSPMEQDAAVMPTTATTPARSSSEESVSAMLGGLITCLHGMSVGNDCGDPTCEACGAIFFNATPSSPSSDASSSSKAVLDFLADTTAPAAPRASRKRVNASAGSKLSAHIADEAAKAEQAATLEARREEWISRVRGQTRFYGKEKQKESRRAPAPALLHSGPTGGVTMTQGDAFVIAAPRTLLAATRGPVLRTVQPAVARPPLPQPHSISFLPGATMGDLFAGDAIQPTPKSATLLYETKVYHRACQTPCPAPPLARFALHKPKERTTPSEADKAALARKKKPTSVLRLLR